MKWIVIAAIAMTACSTGKNALYKVMTLKDSTAQWLMQQQRPYAMESYTAFEKTMQPVLNNWGAYRVVALGEGTHGTSEFQTLRAYITRYLVEKKGFTTVCLENSFGWCAVLDRYIQTGEGNLDTLMKENLLGMWQNAEMKALLQWMKDFNSRHTNKVHLAGMDYSAVAANGSIIKQITDRIGDRQIDSLAGKLVVHCNYMDEAYADLNNGGKKFAVKEILQNGVKAYETALALDSALQKTTQKSVAADTLGLLATAVYHTQLAFGSIYKPVKQKTQTSRDEIMAQVVKRLAENNPGAGVIVWAHNAHVARGRIFDDSNGGGTGAFLEAYFPGRYFVAATGTAGGSFCATNDRFIVNTSRFTSYSLPAAPDSSWEHAMAAQQNRCLYFDLTNKSKALPELPLRFLGYGQAGNYDFVNVQLNNLFDGFFFVRTTRGTTMLW